MLCRFSSRNYQNYHFPEGFPDFFEIAVVKTEFWLKIRFVMMIRYECDIDKWFFEEVPRV